MKELLGLLAVWSIALSGAGVVVGGDDVTYTLTVTAPIYVLNWPTATACKSSTWTLLDTGTHTATLPGSQCV